jgi:tellurite resistance protein
VASLLRWQRHPQAWTDDLKHPVRHTLVATLPVATLLLATVGVAALGPNPVVRALWWAGSLGQFGVTLWVLARWWRPKDQGGLAWPSITPALLIPVVGNVVAPLGGVALGHGDWATAQFGIGLLLWPVVLALLGPAAWCRARCPSACCPPPSS